VTQKSARDYAELLRAGRWFGSLPTDLQDALLDAGHLKSLASGERLFARGDPPNGLYAVLDGGLRISGSGEGGREALLAFTGPPTWIGEIAVFDGQPRTHDAIAAAESLVLHVPQPALDAHLAKHPEHWRELGLLIASKLRLAFVAMEDDALLPNATRLARRILMLAEAYGEWVDRTVRAVKLRQEQLALMLSMSRQTANALLKELESQGIVRLSYGEIEIVDLERLREAARATR